MTPRAQDFRLKYVSAAESRRAERALFEKAATPQYFDMFGYPARKWDRQNAGRLYGKVRITSEPYANARSLLLTPGKPRGGGRKCLKQLDAPSQAGRRPSGWACVSPKLHRG